MRVLRGSKVIEAPSGWLDHLRGRRVVVDLGAGDGRWVYESARADPEAAYIAIDPDAEALADYAFRASRKPARGGVENASFVVASVELLPVELAGIADLVRINYPWGSLLRGLIESSPSVIAGLASLLAPGGRLEIVVAYVPEFDPNAFAGEPLTALDEAGVEALKPAYAAAGIRLESALSLTQDDALAIASTWGRRLLHARARPVLLVRGVKLDLTPNP